MGNLLAALRLIVAVSLGVLRRVGVGLRWLLLLALMLLLLRHSTTQRTPYYAVAAYVKDAHFDYIGWTLGAVYAKTRQTVSANHAAMTDAEQVAFVRDYMDDVSAVQRLNAQIEAAYIDPNTPDPDAATAQQRGERDALRESLRRRQSAVEAILQNQVASVLVEEGFDMNGALFPPVNMRFVGQTLLLVTSPRDAIEMKYPMTLTPIPVDEREVIEQRIHDEQDLSAVIVPIGGMALYPAMVVESGNLSYLVDTFAHEWLHHYLMFHPLGWEAELFQNPEARIINETTASIFGREVAGKVLARYYPDLLPPPVPSSDADSAPPPESDPAPPAFDFGAAMHETRVTVDDLLAEDKIAEAEAYMEERRRLFVENGYGIRKMNQAWFAFYGGYQVEGINAGGEDPIGPAVHDLYAAAPSIREWVYTMQTLTTRAALLETAGDITAAR